jgi:glutamate-1-semialdehyde 2,1-aminomutase
MPDKSRPAVNSDAAFQRAKQLMPGGVSSPVRAFKGVGGTPVFIKEGSGAVVKDVDGNSYIDYVGSYGPLIAGHANERVVAALSKAIGRGTSFGFPTESEAHLAQVIVGAFPSGAVEMVRFVNSGTEAAMSAIRLARAATGRDIIVKCIGCYHGHADALLVEAGSGALTLGTPSSPGVPKSVTAATALVHYNDLDGARAVFEKYSGQIAAFLVEPVAGNMGVVPPADGYLQGLRELCDKHQSLLVFDEVMTGFRVAWGGAQVRYNVKPDITVLGKVIGGGVPCAAYGASRRLMEMISPAGPVYQAGTLSGNPLAMAAGLSTLEILKEGNCYEQLERRSAMLAEGLIDAAGAAGVPVALNRVGSMLTPFFRAAGTSSASHVGNFTEAVASDTKAYATFFHAMLDEGVHLAPSQYEAMFVGLAHTDEQIEQTITAAEAAFAAVAVARGKAQD